MKRFTLVFFLLCFHLFAVEVVEVKGNIQDLNLKILKTIYDISEKKPIPNERTYGFDYRYNFSWKNPYDFNIYLGSFSQNQNNLLRIESSKNGEEKILKSILYQKLYPKQNNPYFLDIKPFKKKSHFVSQGLNIISPFMSVAYNSYKSPLYTSKDASSTINRYFLVDFFIIGVASWYIQEKTPKKSQVDNILLKGGPSMSFTKNPNGQIALGLLFFVRLFRMTGAIHDTSFHNRMADLSYTIRF